MDTNIIETLIEIKKSGEATNSIYKWLPTINTGITGLVAIWIAVVFNKNLTVNRALLNYFIDNNKDLKNEYTSFFQNLIDGKLSALDVTVFFKRMTQKIEFYESLLKDKLIIECSMLLINNEFKKKLTNSDDFNQSFNLNAVIISKPTIDSIVIPYEIELNKVFMINVVKVNTSKINTRVNRFIASVNFASKARKVLVVILFVVVVVFLFL